MTKCTKARVRHGSEKGITREEIQSSIITYVKQVQTVTPAHVGVKVDSFQECETKGSDLQDPEQFTKIEQEVRKTKQLSKM